MEGGGRATQLPTQILVDRVRTLRSHLLAEQEEEKQAVATNKSRFKKNDVTKLLFAVCDKLTEEKAKLEQRNYEEHSADLHVLCRKVGADLEAGISDKACQEKLHEQSLSLQEAQKPSRKQQARGLLAMCFTSEFPPSKDWWLSAKEFLTPKYEVWRDSQLVNVPPSTLVLGDIICLHRGCRAPCDVRILVTLEGTSMDVPCFGSAVSDIRTCTAECTSTDIKSSRNIVLKDSWIVSGSLVGLVVRAPVAPIIPAKLKASKDDFILDMNLPSGLGQSTCRNTFTSLCMRASFACKSFGAIPRLAQVQALVIVLDKELLSPDSPALSSLLASTKRLNKSLFLIGAQEQMVEDFQSLSKVSALKVLDLTPSSGAEAPSSELPSGFDSGEGSSIDADVDTKPGSEEKARLDPLIDDCVQGDTCAVALRGISEVALCYLCASLQEHGLQLLYALGGHFRFPRCLRSLIVASAGNSLRGAGDCGSERSDEASASELLVAPRSTLQSVIGGDVQPDVEESASALSDSAAYARSTVALGHLKRVLLVSVGLKGILAQHADCVLLKPDLACLGQALEIATRAVPADMLGGGPAGRINDAD
eukprot:TRINITY_DN3440_c0_g1_i1.p1 TRINITY_DN3440_c0_g1~~TRINITY_DN3440_c0_g1_i1.p1  ORF type:complete len:592 (-),score=118.08 TRINITY_DN3440_c0_g1_i1:71-1846(-)